MDCIVHGIAESESTEGLSLLIFFMGRPYILDSLEWSSFLCLFLKSNLTISFLYHSQNCLCVGNKLHLLGSKLATLVNVYFSAWILKLHRGQVIYQGHTGSNWKAVNLWLNDCIFMTYTEDPENKKQGLAPDVLQFIN